MASQELVLVILFIQLEAFPFALFYGSLSEKFGARPMILTGIGVY